MPVRSSCVDSTAVEMATLISFRNNFLGNEIILLLNQLYLSVYPITGI